MDDWISYDGVAEAYERGNGSRFGVIALDLLELASPLPASPRVLDVGTGTGAAASAIASAGAGLVVGADRSLRMLQVGRDARDGFRPVAAQAIDLPFRDYTFDLVSGTFVIAHFPKYQTALFDMIRVLRSEGKLVLATWAKGNDELMRTWRSLVETVVQEELLDDILGQAVPWEDRFAERAPLEEALIDAGLQHVRTEPKQYKFGFTIDEYLDGREASSSGRFVKSMLGPESWSAFRERAHSRFAGEFADPLNDFRDVILAVATKP